MNPSEEKELSIDTPQGLQEFLSFVQDVYRDYIVALQQTEGAEVLVRGDLVAVEIANRKAEELVAHHTKVLEFGGEIYEEDIAELQSLYDSIVAAYDRLTKAPAPTVTPEQAYQALGSVDGLDATLDRAKLLAVHVDELVYEFSELETATITTAELKLGKLLYEQLKACSTDVLTKVKEIEQFSVIASREELLHVAKKIDADLDTLTEAIEQLQKSLLRFFEADDFKDQTPERKQVSEQDVRDERAAKLFGQQSLFSEAIKTLLADQSYRAILQSQFSSPAAFEAALRREVYRVEAPSKLDALLGVKHTSAFLFLKDMTLSAIDAFDGQTNRAAIRAELQKRGILYETYMAWMQALPYMESLVVAHDDMTFLELFVRSEIELLKQAQMSRGNTQGVYNK